MVLLQRGAMEYVQKIERFLNDKELDYFADLVEQHSGLLRASSGRGTLGPRYEAVEDTLVRQHMPELVTLWDQRIWPIGRKLTRLGPESSPADAVRLRVQRYVRKDHSFRWHFDGYSNAALLTLKNTNRGETQLISYPLSSALRPFLYLVYPFPQVFSLMPRTSVTMQAGDLLLMRGTDLLHRGVTLDNQGERVLVVYLYNEAKPKLSTLRGWIARWIND